LGLFHLKWLILVQISLYRPILTQMSCYLLLGPRQLTVCCWRLTGSLLGSDLVRGLCPLPEQPPIQEILGLFLLEIAHVGANSVVF